MQTTFSVMTAHLNWLLGGKENRQYNGSGHVLKKEKKKANWWNGKQVEVMMTKNKRKK